MSMYKNLWSLLLLGATTMNIISSTQHNLIDITTVIPNIQLDIRYATTNNFTGKQVYPDIAAHHCFLQEPAAHALAAVQKELAPHNLQLKIFDAYRPHAVQFIFWDLMPDERYVGNPAKGSKHNRGCAVDVTLTNLDGVEVAMPSEFDDFSEQAHANYTGNNEHVRANLTLLQQIMTKHGFAVFPTEWWHFDYKDWNQYPILDVPFEDLVK